MAIECPYGCGRKNVVVNITADGSNPDKASDVVARRLACGHVVGGEEYEKFAAIVAKIDLDHRTAIRNIDEDARSQKGAAYAAFVSRREE